jgi:uncharacterized membrane protein
MEHQHNGDASAGSSGTERLAAFSDGVIAIIITIMVLELKLPESASHGEVWSNFLEPLAPKLAIYALSFCIVGTMWINHHQLLAAIRRGSPPLMWLNLLLLFFMSLIPLATSFLGEHPFLPRAISFYALILASSSVVFGLLRYHLSRMPEHDRRQMPFRRATLVRSFVSTLLYAAAAILAAYAPIAALALTIFVPVMFNIPMIFGRDRSR